MDTVIWREIRCPFPGASYDKELLLHEEIFRDESLRAARLEQFDNRGQKMGEEEK